MSYASNIHVAVYQVLDDVFRAQVAPPGAKSLIHSIIDDLHVARAPRAMIEKTENISLQLHKLEYALVRRDRIAAADARHCLREIAASWLDYRIKH